MGIGHTRDIGARELGMHVIDSSAILTEADRDCIFTSRMITLAGEYDPFTCDRHLMDQSLIAKCIDDPIERREIHSIVSLTDELLLQIGEGDTRRLSELFDEALAGEGDTGDHSEEK